MDKIERLLNIARAEIGYHEKATNSQLDNPTANAGSNNYQKYGRDLYAHGYYNGNKNGYEWCDQFVDWCFLQLCGSKTLAEKVQCQTGPYGAGCTWSAKYYKAQGRLFYEGPQAGDQIFFKDYAHTGIVEYVSNNVVHTIEGNSSNQVERKQYDVGSGRIEAYGRPFYEFAPEVEDLPFKDVNENDWYFDAVKWCYENKITSGTSADTFSPNEPCTRAQVVTMIWKANGAPEPVVIKPYSDVFPGDYYYKAVQWAVQQEITAGVDDNHFAPKRNCTRAEAVTLLWASKGRPSCNGSIYSDVKPEDYFAIPVVWAKKNGVTSGTDQSHFSPNQECSRAMFATMLYKAQM